MIIDLVHTQPLFREAPDELKVKYTHPETGVNIEIPYDDLVSTVMAINSMLEEEAEGVAEEPMPAQVEESPAEDVVLGGAPSGLKVMRSRIPADEL
jgi:hypothetical protein